MTLGVIIGIIASILIFIILIKSPSLNNLFEIWGSLLLSIGIGIVMYTIVSIAGAFIIQEIYKDENKYLTLISENTMYVSAAKIDLDFGEETLLYAITNGTVETNKIDLDDINLIESDTDKPYIVVKSYKCKFRFITHALDKTTYEYYGHINDLYK